MREEGRDCTVIVLTRPHVTPQIQEERKRRKDWKGIREGAKGEVREGRRDRLEEWTGGKGRGGGGN